MRTAPDRTPGDSAGPGTADIATTRRHTYGLPNQSGCRCRLFPRAMIAGFTRVHHHPLLRHWRTPGVSRLLTAEPGCPPVACAARVSEREGQAALSPLCGDI